MDPACFGAHERGIKLRRTHPSGRHLSDRWCAQDSENTSMEIATDNTHQTGYGSAGGLLLQARDHHRQFVFGGFRSSAEIIPVLPDHAWVQRCSSCTRDFRSEDTTGTSSSSFQPQHDFVAPQKGCRLGSSSYSDDASRGHFNHPNSQPPDSQHARQHVQDQETSQERQPDSSLGCGSDDPAAWFDLDTFLGEAPASLQGIVSGHESDGSGCSASSRIREELLQSDSLPSWCCSTAAVQKALDPALPDEDMPEFSEEDLRMCLDVACQGLGVDLEQTAGARKDHLVCSNDAAHSMDACMNFGAPVTAPPLRASSTTSSVSMPSLPGQAGGTVKGQTRGLPGLCVQQPTTPDGAAASKGATRKRGRPRRYDTTLPLLPGAMEAQAAAAMAGHINGVDSEKRKRTRGAKPKYHFVTAEEAIAHRRERNRITALASYEKRKAHQDALKSEIEQLEHDQAALRQLLSIVQHPLGDKRLVRELLMKPGASMCEVVQIVSSTKEHNYNVCSTSVQALRCIIKDTDDHQRLQWPKARDVGEVVSRPTETPKLADTAGASSRVELRLGDLAAKLAQLKDGAAAPDLDAAMQDLQDEVAHLKSVEEEITGYAERALAEAERLTKENEELRKAQEDAALDRQMVKAMVEAEKLKAAGEAYKHDMMRARVTELEADLQSTRHAAKRETSSMSRALSEARNAISAREKEAQALKLELEKLKAAKSSPENGTAAQANGSSNGPAESAELAEPSGRPLVSEHEEIAVRLMAAGPSGVDQALLAAAAKALRDVSVLDKQLLRAREEKLKLAREVEDLNNTVFSKSFKAPSAWAEREVKYKMEKRDWDAESKKLRETITKLEAENARYRAENKAEEFEAQIQVLSKALSEKEAEKVEVQKELHELQIKSRDISPLGLNLHDIDHDVVHSIIEDMEKHSIGVSAPRTGTPSQSSRGSPSRSGKGSPPRAAVPPLDLACHFVPGSNVEEIIQDYDDKGVGIAGPRSGRSGRRKGEQRLFDGAAPDACAADSFEELHRSNVHDLQSNFLGASQHPSGLHPGSRAVHQSGSKGSEAEQLVGLAGPPSGRSDSDCGQPGSTAEAQSQGIAHVRDGFQEGPPVRPDAHGGNPGAAIENKPSTTPREGLQAAFGSPMHPDSNSLSTLNEEDRGNSGAAVKEQREASRMGRQHAEISHSPSSAPSAAAQQPDAELQQEQQSRGTDQVLSAGAGLDNGPSAVNSDRQRGASSRHMVENAFAVDHQDGEVAWRSGSREASADDFVSEASSTLAGLVRRGSSGTGGTRDSSSDGGDEWDVERRAALKADRAAAEAAWGAHVAENDIGVLRWKAAEAGSRVELYEAQISKMQLALERADQENSRLEQELRALTESSTKGREERQLTGLAGLRDRMRSISLLTGGSALEQQASERLQDAGEKLKSVQHERAALQKQRDALARQLAHIGEKISSGIIPDASELAVPEHIAAAAEASASATEVSGGDKSKSLGRPRFSGIGHVYAGLSDEEVEVMRLREENETLMETLVRTKVELAETQGDYLKTRRALLRSVEKQAHMSERMDSVKSAVSEGELEIAASLLLTSSPANRTRSAGGNTESLGERETY
ncbi:g11247 [Coccomyxa elongata]